MKHMLDRLSGKPDKDDDAHAEAKMQVLHELRNMAMGMMGDKVKSKMPGHEAQSVTVEAPDGSGMSAGLDLAKKLTSKGDMGDSGMLHEGTNGSEMDAAAGESAGRIALGRHEPSGDQGEPDQDMHNREYASLNDDDDMGDDEIDSMIEELQAKKQARSQRR